MDINKILELLKNSPVWVRVIAVVVTAAIACVLLFSCGVPRTTVTVSQGGNSTIEQSTTSTTTITVTAENRE